MTVYVPGFGYVSSPTITSQTLQQTGTSPTAQQQQNLGALSTLSNTSLTDNRVRYSPSTVFPASTSGVSQQTFTYPATLPPLSPEMQEMLMRRRRAATSALEGAQADYQRGRQEAQSQTLLAQNELNRQVAEQRRGGMAELAGRGVARSPMFRNPFVQGLLESQQRESARLQTSLGGTLQQLDRMLRDAEIAREREVQQIDWDAIMARSNVESLLGIRQ